VSAYQKEPSRDWNQKSECLQYYSDASIPAFWWKFRPLIIFQRRLGGRWDEISRLCRKFIKTLMGPSVLLSSEASSSSRWMTPLAEEREEKEDSPGGS